ncbi:MAG: phosphonate ABC transporter, permease protein PhnE, partial [Chloroflexota bacterium]|nr:phosphonate ABC transporter, permease protein PhnE [Chloroflexota bacterium]
EHIDMGPVEALTATGANLVQTIRYGVIPQIVPSFLAYTLLRWDINMRAATVVGFVGGGGIGFFILETIRKGAYNQYAAALWAIAVVIVVVDYISGALTQRIRAEETRIELAQPQPFYRSPRNVLLMLLGLAGFYYCWYITKIDLRTLFEPAPTFVQLVKDFLSLDLSQKVVDTALRQLITTVFQALLATTLGAIFAIPFSFLAARNLTGRSRLSIWIYYLTRGLFDILRSIEALLYVAIFVFWVGIGAFAGTLALAITSFALVGKLYADAIENIDMGPMEAITATGANRLQAIVYAILPQIIPPFVSFSIYQWDINVRMATIIGFAGGGGIGLLLNGYFGLLQYQKAGTIVAMIVIVVAAMDFASAKIREQMV